MKIEKRGEIRVLLCSCCNLPFAKVQFGRLVIQSRHHGEDHTNALELEDLKRILELISEDSVIISVVQPS